jgi:hypothetical protein
MRGKRNKRLLLLTSLLFLGSCAPLKPWERENLSLAPMQPDGSLLETFDRNAEVYREGAVGGSGGKSGGGCGCS